MNTNEVLQTGVSGMLTLVMAKFMLNYVPHTVLRSPGNPTGSETSDIIARTGMKEFEYKWFPEPEEERPGRVYPYTRTKQIGSYEIRMTRTDSTHNKTVRVLIRLEEKAKSYMDRYGQGCM